MRLPELARFGAVGTVGMAIDLGGAALLHGMADAGPLLAKTISVAVASVFSYAGNRMWTFRHRASHGFAREWPRFFALNLAGLLISLLVIGLAGIILGQGVLSGPIAYNMAQAGGTLLANLFRYWSYRKWVFPAAVASSAGSVSSGAFMIGETSRS